MARSKSSNGHPWLKRIVIALIAAVGASMLARRKALAPAPQFDLQLPTRPAPPAEPAKSEVAPPARLLTPAESVTANPPTEEAAKKESPVAESTLDSTGEPAADAAPTSDDTTAESTEGLASEELDDLEEDEAESDAGLPLADDPVSAALNSGNGYMRMTNGERSCPDAFPIKGNASSHIFHRPGESSYEATIPEICFADEGIADSMGYRPRKH